MFRLPVADILTSYPGYTKNISFSGDVYHGYFEDFDFTKPLTMEIALRNENPKKLTATILFLKTRGEYRGQEKEILLENISQCYSLTGENEERINPEDMTIDLAPFLHTCILEAFLKE